jgi:hypothetical protein
MCELTVSVGHEELACRPGTKLAAVQRRRGPRTWSTVETAVGRDCRWQYIQWRAMDGLEIAHRRLHGQHLSGAPLADPAAVVGHLGAVQAQEYAIAKWSVGQRTAGFDDAAVQRAIDEGAILRTHALRPTWLFVAAADIVWLQALTGPRVHAFNAYYNRARSRRRPCRQDEQGDCDCATWR